MRQRNLNPVPTTVLILGKTKRWCKILSKPWISRKCIFWSKIPHGIWSTQRPKNEMVNSYNVNSEVGWRTYQPNCGNREDIQLSWLHRFNCIDFLLSFAIWIVFHIIYITDIWIGFLDLDLSLHLRDYGWRIAVLSQFAYQLSISLIWSSLQAMFDSSEERRGKGLKRDGTAVTLIATSNDPIFEFISDRGVWFIICCF